jgi:hypothetical protein
MRGAYIANFANALVHAVSKLLQLAWNQILVEEEFQLWAVNKEGGAWRLRRPPLLSSEVV